MAEMPSNELTGCPAYSAGPTHRVKTSLFRATAVPIRGAAIKLETVRKRTETRWLFSHRPRRQDWKARVAWQIRFCREAFWTHR